MASNTLLLCELNIFQVVRISTFNDLFGVLVFYYFSFIIIIIIFLGPPAQSQQAEILK